MATPRSQKVPAADGVALKIIRTPFRQDGRLAAADLTLRDKQHKNVQAAPLISLAAAAHLSNTYMSALSV